MKALVVEDDPDYVEIVGDCLESLKHDYDAADKQQTARECLTSNGYDYILLDLEIPHRPNRDARRQNGENLLGEIHEQYGSAIPVIITSGYGATGPDLAVEMMKKGAVDYVTKPFATYGKTLDHAIQEALQRAGKLKGSRQKQRKRPAAFKGGELIVYYDRVELCGVAISIGELTRRLLIELRHKRESTGEYIGYSARELADRLEHLAGYKSISNAVHDFRDKLQVLLLDEANINCDRQDVVCSGNRGYRFNEWIDVRVATVRKQSKKSGSNKNEAPVSSEHNERQIWILKQLESGLKLRATHVAERFQCSTKTAKRDLAALREANLIEFVGPPRTGHYVKR